MAATSATVAPRGGRQDAQALRERRGRAGEGAVGEPHRAVADHDVLVAEAGGAVGQPERRRAVGHRQQPAGAERAPVRRERRRSQVVAVGDHPGDQARVAERGADRARLPAAQRRHRVAEVGDQARAAADGGCHLLGGRLGVADGDDHPHGPRARRRRPARRAAPAPASPPPRRPCATSRRPAPPTAGAASAPGGRPCGPARS
ncbi:hypothetical protein [Nocardioides sp. TF02-7]|uniref:hypothetical protein n=1 Tax=Nocardioides sp. TF02-7 TaxID=2917724 RepID=UPI001F06A66D|nr:hypothetical protein [Nocardioides sp. TF02-7]UMG93402.1 hypothetical protein MF408_03920 [Nocardioides sp. TF02-7]